MELVDIWRKIIVGDDKSWVLFENGTIVLTKTETDLSAQGIKLLEEYGKVYAGTSAGDFSVIELRDHEGWIVTCHHPDILNYVSPAEVETSAEDWKIGLTGRSKRDYDAHELNVIHVEDNRK